MDSYQFLCSGPSSSVTRDDLSSLTRLEDPRSRSQSRHLALIRRSHLCHLYLKSSRQHNCSGIRFPMWLTMTFRAGRSLCPDGRPGVRLRYGRPRPTATPIRVSISQQLLVERALANGETFQDFTRGAIFEPLQMTHTRWRDDFRAVVPNRALAYGPARNGASAFSINS